MSILVEARHCQKQARSTKHAVWPRGEIVELHFELGVAVVGVTLIDRHFAHVLEIHLADMKGAAHGSGFERRWSHPSFLRKVRLPSGQKLVEGFLPDRIDELQ